MKKIGIVMFILGAVIIASCASNKEEELPKKSSGCDTTNITYTNTISPMLVSYGCVGCHNTQGASGGVVLDSYAEVNSNTALVIPAITKDPNLSSSKYMPPGASVSECDINKFKAWVNAGSPQ